MVLNIYYFIFSFHIIIYFPRTETIRCDFVKKYLFKKMRWVYDKIKNSWKVQLNIYKNQAAHELIFHFLLVFSNVFTYRMYVYAFKMQFYIIITVIANLLYL